MLPVVAKTSTACLPRDPSDASNGKLAQDKSMSGRFDVIKIPYGQYYIVGVANLGNAKSDKYSEATTTYHELFVDAERKEAVKTIDGLRGLRLEWDASCLANNAPLRASPLAFDSAARLPVSPSDIGVNSICNDIVPMPSGMKSESSRKSSSQDTNISDAIQAVAAAVAKLIKVLKGLALPRHPCCSQCVDRTLL